MWRDLMTFWKKFIFESLPLIVNMNSFYSKTNVIFLLSFFEFLCSFWSKLSFFILKIFFFVRKFQFPSLLQNHKHKCSMRRRNIFFVLLFFIQKWRHLTCFSTHRWNNHHLIQNNLITSPNHNEVSYLIL